MKLCISTLACPQWTLEQIIDGCAAAGIGGIDFRGLGEEIDITKLPQFNEHLPQTLSMLAARNLAMPSLNTSVTLVTPAPQRWQQMLEETQRAARLAEKTRTQWLRIFGGGVPKDMSRGEARNLGQRHLRQVVKICSQFGCMPLLETHDDWATSAQILELLHEFDPQEVGVLWDVEHPFRRGERPADTYAALGRFVRHMHLKDSVRVEGKNKPRLLGEGELPLKECYDILRNNGYHGWFSLETEKRWHADAPEPEQSVPQFAVFMRKLELS